MWVEASCNSPEDCPGSKCCATYVGTLTAMHCDPNCDAAGEFVMCTGDPSVCASDQTCTTFIQGYDYCS